ncbi:MAG: NYN domain-containing protein [Planctomycetota bacterium]
MNPVRAFGFVDGGYLRKRAEDNSKPLPDPWALPMKVLGSQGYGFTKSCSLQRVTYYDAAPDSMTDVPEHLSDYWDAVELIDDVHLGFGYLRGGKRKKPPRQKAVDTLLTVDMLVGAFTGIYTIAILVAGDADFVPVVNEVQRRGAMVILAGTERTVSNELKRSVDRFHELTADDLTALKRADGGIFKAES